MKKSTKKAIYIIVCAVCAVSVVIEALFVHPHGTQIWHTLPGADILIAFFGGWLLIITAKKVMAQLLQRDENYYDDEGGYKGE